LLEIARITASSKKNLDGREAVSRAKATVKRR
jgi:hypothetical protein